MGESAIGKRFRLVRKRIAGITSSKVGEIVTCDGETICMVAGAAERCITFPTSPGCSCFWPLADVEPVGEEYPEVAGRVGEKGEGLAIIDRRGVPDGAFAQPTAYWPLADVEPVEEDRPKHESENWFLSQAPLKPGVYRMPVTPPYVNEHGFEVVATKRTDETCPVIPGLSEFVRGQADRAQESCPFVAPAMTWGAPPVVAELGTRDPAWDEVEREVERVLTPRGWSPEQRRMLFMDFCNRSRLPAQALECLRWMESISPPQRPAPPAGSWRDRPPML